MSKFASELPSTEMHAGPWNPNDLLPVAFATLPQHLYAADPHWLGEDPLALAQAFSMANPWFAQPNHRAWLGVIPGQARLAGFYCGQEVDGERVAFFGFWEGINELAPHQELFQALCRWAKAQGATRVYGPINFSTFGAYRVRLDGFEAGCFPGEPWNPPYYAALMTQLGFSERYRYLSTSNQVADVVAQVGPDYARYKPKLESVVSFSALSGEFWMDNLDELYGFVDNVFGGNFAYSSPSLTQFKAQCGKPFADKLCPHTSALATAHDGRIAGFFLVFPDYAPLIKRGIRNISYHEHAHLLPEPRHALAKTGGVLPAFRELGLFTAMGCELSLRAEGRYQQISACLVRADNPSRQFALRHGVASQRQYALYQQALL